MARIILCVVGKIVLIQGYTGKFSGLIQIC